MPRPTVSFRDFSAPLRGVTPSWEVPPWIGDGETEANRWGIRCATNAQQGIQHVCLLWLVSIHYIIKDRNWAQLEALLPKDQQVSERLRPEHLRPVFFVGEAMDEAFSKERAKNGRSRDEESS